jgi:hypothetical protein
MHLAINKQFSNNLSLALTIRDLFHTNVIKREIVGDRFNIRSKTINDSQIVGLNFNIHLGSIKNKKLRKPHSKRKFQECNSIYGAGILFYIC